MPEHDLCGKNGHKIIENISKYYQKCLPSCPGQPTFEKKAKKKVKILRNII